MNTNNTTGTLTENNFYHTTYTPSDSIPSGTNYLKIQFSGGSYSWNPQLSKIRIDYGGATPTPTPTPTSTPVPGWTRVNDNASGTSYSGCYVVSPSGYYNNDCHYSNTAGSYVEYTFTGTGVRWIGKKDSDHGKADVYIDTVFDSTIDTYNSIAQLQQVCYAKTGLTSGSHTIKIVVRSDKNPSSTNYYSDWDAFEYLQ